MQGGPFNASSRRAASPLSRPAAHTGAGAWTRLSYRVGEIKLPPARSSGPQRCAAADVVQRRSASPITRTRPRSTRQACAVRIGAGTSATHGGTRSRCASAGPSSRESAHRNRPLRYDGRMVVTLCADDVLYLPVTTEISSLPQLTPEGLPLALARRAAEDRRMANAVAELEKRGEAVTARAVAAAAHISLNTACAWLRQRETGAMEPAAALSVVHYSSHSIADNMPAAEESACTEAPDGTPDSVDPPEARPEPTSVELPTPMRPLVCPAASHQLLWRWHAGSWLCPACGG
jgi:hypothetical protein